MGKICSNALACADDVLLSTTCDAFSKVKICDWYATNFSLNFYFNICGCYSFEFKHTMHNVYVKMCYCNIRNAKSGKHLSHLISFEHLVNLERVMRDMNVGADIISTEMLSNTQCMS